MMASTHAKNHNWLKKLISYKENGHLVRLDRNPVSSEAIDGFVLDASGEFLLVQRLDSEYYLNGYTIIRTDSVKRYRILKDYDMVAERALSVTGDKWKMIKISLGDARGLFSDLMRKKLVVALHRETKRPNVCYVGIVVGVLQKTLQLKEIDPGAKWANETKFRFAEVSRIDFLGGYERTLGLLAFGGNIGALGRSAKT